ncbi:MAG: hypothetical protein PHT12_01850 [Patescibacteria group bacterium]|nr:hypothetical protein [Patescibacteria group bacterium]
MIEPLVFPETKDAGAAEQETVTNQLEVAMAQEDEEARFALACEAINILVGRAVERAPAKYGSLIIDSAGEENSGANLFEAGLANLQMRIADMLRVRLDEMFQKGLAANEIGSRLETLVTQKLDSFAGMQKRAKDRFAPPEQTDPRKMEIVSEPAVAEVPIAPEAKKPSEVEPVVQPGDQNNPDETTSIELSDGAPGDFRPTEAPKNRRQPEPTQHLGLSLKTLAREVLQKFGRSQDGNITKGAKKPGPRI